MGKHFGELHTNLRGIITFKISPFEQRAFAGCIERGIPNIIQNRLGCLVVMLPPFIVGALSYIFIEKRHEQLMRKNPDDFKDDK